MTALPDAAESSHSHESPHFLRTFLYYLIPSVVGLLSISTASVVDGLLVAHFLGPSSLAAVNVLIPVITFYFGVGLMLAVGVSVRAAFYLGQQREADASTIFSNCVLLTALFAVIMMAIATLLQEQLFAVLGAPREIFPLLRDYFPVLLLGWLPQLLAVVFYYCLRSLGYPRAATGALVAGALVNIMLDWIFLSVFRWGLASAAWATVAAQLIQCGALLLLFRCLPHRLFWRPRWRGWMNVVRAGANGFSELINEISVGVVLGVLHWLLLRHAGTDAMAGFALVNYSLFIHTMIGCAVAEVVYTLVSRNVGSGRYEDAQVFFRLGLWVAVIVSGTYTFVLLMFGPAWIDYLFPSAAAHYSHQYLTWIWPAFIACACSLVLSAYFTGLQNARASASIALLRSLLLPLIFFLATGRGWIDLPPVAAIVFAEWITLGVAVWWWRYSSENTQLRQMQQL
jgi:putative MATE family efflux protein